MENSSVILLLFGIWGIITAVVSLIMLAGKYGDAFYKEVAGYPETDFESNKLLNFGVFIGVLGMIYLFMVGALAMTGQEITGKKWIEILVPVAIIGTVAIGLTMVLINVLPLMMRTFENTIGFALINGGNQLNQNIKAIIKGDNIVDYSVLATQLYVENFKAYLGSMLPNMKEGASISRFANVFVKDDIFNKGQLVFGDDVKQLLEKIIRKRAISEITWISLAAMFTIIGSYYYVV